MIATFYWKIKTQDLCYRKQISWIMYIVVTHDPGKCQNPHYWVVNSCSDNCSGPSGNKPLPEPVLNQGPISQRIHDSNSRENYWFSCNAMIRYHIATKFYTCHDSITVVPCAKFHSDHFHKKKNPTIAEWNFHQTCINMDKLFAVKWTQDLCRHTPPLCYNVT